MGNKNFENLVDKEKYQVFIFSSPASLPINFARHPWIVVNNKGVVSRWEVMHFKNKNDKRLKYIHLNARSPFCGNIVFYPLELLFWKTKLMGFIEGDIALKAIDFIERSIENYVYYDKYSFLGPNSNTYVQWILNKFPEFKIKLSWRFIGKNYRM